MNGFKFTIDGETLLRVIKNALLFACPDDTLPVICAIRFELDGSTVTAVATDRYTLSAETFTPGTAEGSGEFSLHRNDAKALIKMSAWKSPHVPVTVTLEIDKDDAEYYDRAVFDAGYLGKFVYAPVYGEYPRWRNFFEKKPAVTDSFGIDAAKLARFGQVRPAEPAPLKGVVPMVVTLTGGTKEKPAPVIVGIGERFRGVIQSHRVADD